MLPRILVAICAFGPALAAAAETGKETRSPACGVVGKGAWVRLLLEEQVVASLELAPMQATRLASLAREVSEEEPAGCDFSDADCSSKHTRYWTEVIPAFADRASKLLGDEKTQRLRAIYWSRTGPLRIPCEPELVAFLALTDRQLETLDGILVEFQNTADGLLKEVPQDDVAARDEFGRKIKATRTAYGRRCLDVLKADQRDKYDAFHSFDPRFDDQDRAQ